MFLLVSYRHFLSEVMTIVYEKPMCTFLTHCYIKLTSETSEAPVPENTMTI